MKESQSKLAKKPHKGGAFVKTKHQKTKLKPTPKIQNDRYWKRFGHIGTVAIYGIDDFTESLVDYAWKHPEVNIIATDPDANKLSRLNFRMGGLSFSMYRWTPLSTAEFFEYSRVRLIVVAKEFYKDALQRPNPFDTTYVTMEDL